MSGVGNAPMTDSEIRALELQEIANAQHASMVAIWVKRIRECGSTIARCEAKIAPIKREVEVLQAKVRRIGALLAVAGTDAVKTRNLESEQTEAQSALNGYLGELRHLKEERDARKRERDARIADAERVALTTEEKCVRQILGVERLAWDERVAGVTPDHRLLLHNGMRVDPLDALKSETPETTTEQESGAGPDRAQE